MQSYASRSKHLFQDSESANMQSISAGTTFAKFFREKFFPAFIFLPNFHSLNTTYMLLPTHFPVIDQVAIPN